MKVICLISMISCFNSNSNDIFLINGYKKRNLKNNQILVSINKNEHPQKTRCLPKKVVLDETSCVTK